MEEIRILHDKRTMF